MGGFLRTHDGQLNIFNGVNIDMVHKLAAEYPYLISVCNYGVCAHFSNFLQGASVCGMNPRA
jgi:hypothetical protein